MVHTSKGCAVIPLSLCTLREARTRTKRCHSRSGYTFIVVYMRIKLVL
eukprot:gene21144-1172_t